MENGVQEQPLNQAELLAQMFPTDSLEYKLLLRYVQKKIDSHPTQSNSVGEVKAATHPQKHHKTQKNKKRKFLKIISCIRPEREDEDCVTRPPHRQPATAGSSDSDQEEVEQIVNKLTKLTDKVHFKSTDIETDGDDLVEQIVELLREHGDKLNEKIQKDHMLMKQLQDSLSYGFFKKLARSFIHRLSPEELPATQSRKQAEIAITFELTSRLNAMDSHPMNRVLGFGATYLQDYFTPWVNQQGGYEKVFSTDSDAKEEVE
ncbi:apoptosis facilitator Bcl-2-like protein 14 [Tachysurus fulvidraco]|uniref:apoptosis facilitator Bcl-2-like protein 14 n=1 Tax=Tachysurus fulvidraco TaxID=1234273 RepID=UPI000F5010EE|nr:apoptosis facilitator Bcl-2-like protein 14 [Tachysurus fulvidraco]